MPTDREQTFGVPERFHTNAEVAALAAERDRLRKLLLGVQLTEINGRLCARPEPPDPWFDPEEEGRESRCCEPCRTLWGQIDEALR